MSWSIEEHIGECRPFPAQVVIYRGETDECLGYVRGDVADRLKAENERLRELVRDMYACISHANEQDWFYFERDKSGCGMSCTVNGKECGLSVLADRMRELGIEVDE